MQKLTEAMRDAMADMGHNKEEKKTFALVESKRLEDAAIEWAAFCLSELKDDLLKKGLEVSRAISEFVGELEAPVS